MDTDVNQSNPIEKSIQDIREAKSFGKLRFILLGLHLTHPKKQISNEYRMLILLHSFLATYRLLLKLQKSRRSMMAAMRKRSVKNKELTHELTPFIRPKPLPSSRPYLNRESLQSLVPVLLKVLRGAIFNKEQGGGPDDDFKASILAHGILTLGLCHQAGALTNHPTPEPKPTTPEPKLASLTQCQGAADGLAALLVPYLSTIALGLHCSPTSISPNPGHPSHGIKPHLNLSCARDIIPKALMGLTYLDLHPGEEWLDLSIESLVTCLATTESLSGKQAMSAIHSYSFFGVAPIGWRGGFIEELSTIARDGMDELRPLQLSLLIQGFSRLQQASPSSASPHPRTIEWARSFFEKSKGKLSGFSASMASRILGALTLMKTPPPDSWLRSLLTHSYENLGVASQADATALLYNLSRLPRQPPQQPMQQKRQQRSQPSKYQPYPAKGYRGTRAERTWPGVKVWASMERKSVNHLPVIPPSFIHEGMMAARGVNKEEAIKSPSPPPPPGKDGDKGSKRVRPAPERYPGEVKDGLLSSTDVVKLLYVVAREREDPRMALHVSWAKKRLRAFLYPPPPPSNQALCHPLIEDLAGQGLCQPLVDLLYVAAELGMPSTIKSKDPTSEGSLEPCISYILDLLRQTFLSQSPNNLTTTMVCLAVIRARPSEDWTRAFFKQGVARLAPIYRPQELANVLTAASFLGLEPGAEALLRVHERVEAFDLVEVAMMLRKLEQASRQGDGWLGELKQLSKKCLVAKAEKR